MEREARISNDVLNSLGPIAFLATFKGKGLLERESEKTARSGDTLGLVAYTPHLNTPIKVMVVYSQRTA
jgi:hypothetical protein